jgi:hypothetical protein
MSEEFVPDFEEDIWTEASAEDLQYMAWNGHEPEPGPWQEPPPPPRRLPIPGGSRMPRQLWSILPRSMMKDIGKLGDDDIKAAEAEALRRFPDDKWNMDGVLRTREHFVSDFIKHNTMNGNYQLFKLGFKTRRCPFGCGNGFRFGNYPDIDDTPTPEPGVLEEGVKPPEVEL